jgi:SHAQKYF class myb-like DNA-binding protein
MFVVSQKPKNKSKFIIRTDPSRIINPQNIILNTNSQIPKLNPSIIPPQQTQNIIIQKNQPLIKKIFPKKQMFRLTFVRPSYNQNKHKIKNEIKNNSINNKIKQRKNNLSNIKYSCGRWKEDEHKRFVEAIIKYGNDWKQVQRYVKTRSSTQARSHAQKFFVKIKKAKILDFNLDLSKTSIKMFHDMIKEASQEKYDKILSALNSVAFERGSNYEKKKREKIYIRNNINDNNINYINNNILKENEFDTNNNLNVTINEKIINPMNPTNDDANINYILSQLINNLADDNLDMMEHYQHLSARKISVDSNFDNKSYLSKRRKRSSISSYNEIIKGFNEEIINDNNNGFGSNHNNISFNMNFNNNHIDMFNLGNEKEFISLNNSRKVSQDEDYLINVLCNNKKNTQI